MKTKTFSQNAEEEGKQPAPEGGFVGTEVPKARRGREGERERGEGAMSHGVTLGGDDARSCSLICALRCEASLFCRLQEELRRAALRARLSAHAHCTAQDDVSLASIVPSQ